MWVFQDLLKYITLVLIVVKSQGRNISPYENGQNFQPNGQNHNHLSSNHRTSHHQPHEMVQNAPVHRNEALSRLPDPRARGRTPVQSLRFPDQGLANHKILSHRKGQSGDRVSIVVCDICPLDAAIAPCTCVCHNNTVADIQCGNELTSCTRLTEILNVATPISHYLRLVVMKTPLQCILENSIWGPPTFQEIILKENLFTTLDNYAFQHFNATLRILNLERNKLQNVYFQTLSDQPLLEHLVLSSNQIMFIPGQGGITLNKLKELRLFNNSLTSVNSKTFEFMPRLEILDLSKNKINTINSEAFSFQNRVTNSHELYINLAYNQIHSLPFDMVSGVENVTIGLQNNYLQSLPEDKFGSILRNTNFQSKVLVSGNPIVCDPGLCWLAKNTTMASCFDNFRCSNMEVNFIDLTTELLGC